MSISLHQETALGKSLKNKLFKFCLTIKTPDFIAGAFYYLKIL